MTAPVNIEILSQQKDHSWLRITMREGRKRQIRRVAAMLGYPATKLIREEIGPITLGDLKPGKWQHLSNEEVRSLKEIVRNTKKTGNSTSKKKHKKKRKGNN